MLFGILFMMEALGELILFAACLFSFAAGLISLLFFLRFKKPFFVHVFLITFTFLLISTNSFYVAIHGAITSRIFICIFGGFLSLFFSYGIISFALDFIQISPEARFRKLVLIYSAVVLLFAICLIFVPMIEHPSVLLNILGIWIPTAVSVLLGLIFCKRVNTGIFRKEKWLIIVLSIVNLVLLDGKSNKELAETFFVTQKTIEAHLANIYRKLDLLVGGNFACNAFLQFEHYPSITGLFSLGPSCAMNYKINEHNSIFISGGFPLLGYGVRPSYAGCDAKLMKYAEENFFKILTLGSFLSIHNYQSVLLNVEYKLKASELFSTGLGFDFEYARIAVPKEKPLYYVNGNLKTFFIFSF